MSYFISFLIYLLVYTFYFSASFIAVLCTQPNEKLLFRLCPHINVIFCFSLRERPPHPTRFHLIIKLDQPPFNFIAIWMFIFEVSHHLLFIIKKKTHVLFMSTRWKYFFKWVFIWNLEKRISRLAFVQWSIH